MSGTILVVEDDPMLQKLMAIYLEKAGFDIIIAADGKEAIKRFKEESPCFVILDLMLPELSGEQVCHYIREEHESDVPIIMVTAKVQEKERINGLKIGADDYLTKPFSPVELVQRVQTILRRVSHCQKVVVNNLILKPKKQEIWLNNRQLPLTTSEFIILKEFIVHPNQVLSREQLVKKLYPLQEKDIYDRTIDVHIRNIREKLKHSAELKSRIQSIRGVGYKFVTE